MPLNSVEITLEHIIDHRVYPWSASGIPFLVARAVAHNGSELPCRIVKGEMYEPKTHHPYRLYGEIKHDLKYDQDYFHFLSFEILTERSKTGILDYLARFVPGLGPARSLKLYERFGEDTIDILRDDPEAARVVPGVSEHVLGLIRQHFATCYECDPYDYIAAHDLLADAGVPPKVIKQVAVDFKSSLVDVLTDNPYLVIGYDGVGWPTADKVAIDKIQFKKSDIKRYKYGILECLRQLSSDGHTVTTRPALNVAVSKLCGNGGPVDEAMAALVIQKQIDIEEYKKQIFVADKGLADDERFIARRLRELRDSYPGDDIDFSTDGLEGEQIDAVHFIAQNPVCILTGGVGTGKTTCLTNVLRSIYRHGDRVIMLSTPTGKAAKRAGEALSKWMPQDAVSISTIHRALLSACAPDDVGVPEDHAKYGHGRKSLEFPRESDFKFDATDISIDEQSMVPVRLEASFLGAAPDGARLIIVGDENQLPSIEAGATMRDMIKGGVPTFRLTKPRRNCGRIVRACHDILAGRVPVPSPYYDPENGENWVHIPETNPDRIADIIVKLHENCDRDPLWDFQVISPERGKKPVACENLNRLLSAFFNPRNHAPKKDDKGPQYAVLDKIIRKKNGFVYLMEEDPFGDGEFAWQDKEYILSKTYVVNGDIGQVLDVTEHRGIRYIIARFRNSDRLCRLPYGEAHLELAYATTVHSYQGSGCPVVIFPLHTCFYDGLMTRELVYTLFGRPEELLVTVGDLSALRAAVGRKTVNARQTRLARFIQEEFAR